MSNKVISPEMLPHRSRENIQILRDELIQAVSKYAQPDYRKAFGQIANTFLPYLGLWALMIVTVLYEFPVWTTLLLAVPAAGFLVRIFILFHDCCHGAFFPSRSANRILGYISGILTFTAYEDWKRTHVTSCRLGQSGPSRHWRHLDAYGR